MDRCAGSGAVAPARMVAGASGAAPTDGLHAALCALEADPEPCWLTAGEVARHLGLIHAGAVGSVLRRLRVALASGVPGVRQRLRQDGRTAEWCMPRAWHTASAGARASRANGMERAAASLRAAQIAARRLSVSWATLKLQVPALNRAALRQEIVDATRIRFGADGRAATGERLLALPTAGGHMRFVFAKDARAGEAELLLEAISAALRRLPDSVVDGSTPRGGVPPWITRFLGTQACEAAAVVRAASQGRVTSDVLRAVARALLRRASADHDRAATGPIPDTHWLRVRDLWGHGFGAVGQFRSARALTHAVVASDLWVWSPRLVRALPRAHIADPAVHGADPVVERADALLWCAAHQADRAQAMAALRARRLLGWERGLPAVGAMLRVALSRPPGEARAAWVALEALTGTWPEGRGGPLCTAGDGSACGA